MMKVGSGSKKRLAIIISSLTMLALILLVLCLVFVVNRPKNEKEIIEDLNSDASWSPYCELKVNNLIIEKRKTDKRQKTDVIYADIEAESESGDIQFDLRYRLNYELYNEGWMLEDIKPEKIGKWKISKPTVKDVHADLCKQKCFFELNGVSFDSLNLEYEDCSQDTSGTEYWVTFDGRQDEEKFQAVANGRFHYKLGKDGWEYQEDSLVESAGFIPKYAMDEAEVENILKKALDEDVSEIKKVAEHKAYDRQLMAYEYDCYKKYNYLTVVQRYVVMFTFSNASAEWQWISTNLEYQNREWTLVGHRYGIDYEDSTFYPRNLSVCIDSIEDLNLKYSYTCSAGYQGGSDSDTIVCAVNTYNYDDIIFGVNPMNQLNMWFKIRLDKNQGLMISAVDNYLPSITLIEETPMIQYD